MEATPPRTSTSHVVVRGAQIAAATAGAAGAFVRESFRLSGAPDRTPRAAGRALVGLCTRLGATFIKIGQIASTRSDLLPQPLVDELVALQDRVPSFPFEQVRDTIESDLGRPLGEIFADFEREPIAAASVAQVHRAVLRSNGARVAVKVRRPDILEKIRLDRSILLAVGGALERVVPTMRLVDVRGALATFCDAVGQQAHLVNEADHNRRFTANFEGDPDIGFPVLHPEACSDAVLTMDFVDGVREEDLVPAGVDVRALVATGMRCVCRMIFLHGFVHADLHPGNLRFQPPGRLVLLDLGLVGEISEVDRVTTARTIHALATGDGVTVARMFYENAAHANVSDYAAYEREIVEFVDAVRARGLANLEVTREIGRIFDILRRHRIQARSHMTMANLAMMTAEGLGKRLAPELSLTDESIPYLVEALASAPGPAAA
ncbi:MAG: ABC1 kinase family protein, partial [Alphaproteobacteria bacterium]